MIYRVLFFVCLSAYLGHTFLGRVLAADSLNEDGSYVRSFCQDIVTNRESLTKDILADLEGKLSWPMNQFEKEGMDKEFDYISSDPLGWYKSVQKLCGKDSRLSVQDVRDVFVNHVQIVQKVEESFLLNIQIDPQNKSILYKGKLVENTTKK